MVIKASCNLSSSGDNSKSHDKYTGVGKHTHRVPMYIITDRAELVIR